MNDLQNDSIAASLQLADTNLPRLILRRFGCNPRNEPTVAETLLDHSHIERIFELEASRKVRDHLGPG